MKSTRIAAALAGAIALPTAVAASSACSTTEEPRATAAPCTTTKTTTSSTGGAGGATTSTGGAGGASTTSSTGGAGGATTSTGSGGGPSDAGTPSLCAKDVGFWADGMSFAFPTPAPLAEALDRLTYDPTSHPLSVVLLAAGGAEAATIAIGATDTDGFDQVFPPGKKPTFGPALLGETEFSTAGPQLVGWLRVVDEVGPVDIQLANINLSALTKSSCTILSGVIDAEIPESQLGTILHIDGTTRTLGELAGGPVSDGGQVLDGGNGVGTSLHALFVGETMSFDPAKL